MELWFKNHNHWKYLVEDKSCLLCHVFVLTQPQNQYESGGARGQECSDRGSEGFPSTNFI